MKQLLIGNAAVARGAYEAGVRVVASYPGTPSTEITESIVSYPDIYCEWAPNEKVAAEVAIGAAIGGARAMTCCKHVGLNVMADPVFTASYTGVNGGLVIAVADDPGMHSSQNEQDSRHYAEAAKCPMLEPADSAECLAFTKAAYDISESFDTPVFLRLTTRVAHSQSLTPISDPAAVPLKDYQKNPGKFVMAPANAIRRHVDVEQRTLDLKKLAEETPLNQVIGHGAEIGVICAGISYLYAQEALGDQADYLKLGLVWPLPEEKIKEFVRSHRKVYVIEQLDPFIEQYARALGLSVIGKEAFTLLGEYTAQMIREAVLKAPAAPFASSALPVPVRPPVMCAGCPHRGTFYVLKKLGLTVCGDIGCYTLGATPPLGAMDTTICMGASIGAALGMAKARGKEFAKKLVSVIGDSTFIHSGITGLIDVVYNQGINTVLILDNSITGMTGHQDNPTTGRTIRGEATKQVDLELLCKAVGIDRVRICDPFDVKGLEAAVKEEIAAEEPSVIIVQRPCALLKYVKYSGHCRVNADTCRDCRMCMKLGCPALTVREGRVVIDATQCNGCGLCVNVCPFHAIEKEEK